MKMKNVPDPKAKVIKSRYVLTRNNDNNKEKFLIRKNYCDRLLRQSEDKTLQRILLKKLHDGELVYEPDRSAVSSHSPIVTDMKPNRSYDLHRKVYEDSDVSPVAHLKFKPMTNEKMQKVNEKILDDDISLNDKGKFRQIFKDFLSLCETGNKKTTLFSAELMAKDYVQRLSRHNQEEQINKMTEFNYKNEESKTPNLKTKRKKFKIISNNKGNIVIDSNAKINLFFKKPTKIIQPKEVIESKVKHIQQSLRRRKVRVTTGKKLITGWDKTLKNLISVFINKMEGEYVTEIFVKLYSTDNKKTYDKVFLISEVYELSDRIKLSSLNANVLLELIRLSNGNVIVEKIFANGASSPNFKGNSTMSQNVVTEIISIGSAACDESVREYHDEEEYEDQENYNDITIRTFNTESISNDDSLSCCDLNE